MAREAARERTGRRRCRIGAVSADKAGARPVGTPTAQKARYTSAPFSREVASVRRRARRSIELTIRYSFSFASLPSTLLRLQWHETFAIRVQPTLFTPLATSGGKAVPRWTVRVRPRFAAVPSERPRRAVFAGGSTPAGGCRKGDLHLPSLCQELDVAGKDCAGAGGAIRNHPPPHRPRRHRRRRRRPSTQQCCVRDTHSQI